jgi:RNA recognition motif.
MSRDINRNRVFVGRLNPEARTKDLERFFRDKGFSKLKDVNIKLGYAFVVRLYFIKL